MILYTFWVSVSVKQTESLAYDGQLTRMLWCSECKHTQLVWPLSVSAALDCLRPRGLPGDQILLLFLLLANMELAAGTSAAGLFVASCEECPYAITIPDTCAAWRAGRSAAPLRSLCQLRCVSLPTAVSGA